MFTIKRKHIRYLFLSAMLFCEMLVVSQLLAQSEVTMFRGLRLNEIQVIGSHNSYKPGIEPALWQIIQAQDASKALSLQYGHISLTAQLNLGLRNLELDVVHDPVGGRYANPLGLTLIKQAGGTPEPYDVAGDLKKPGLKVFHVQDIDVRSHHLLFVGCLKELKLWSQQHPSHLPVIITINAKDSDVEGLQKMLPFTHEALDSIDKEIKSVFGLNELITPDLVRGQSNTLEQAVLDHGWPKLAEVQGRFLFVLDETGFKLNAYKQGHPSLKDKLMFVNEQPGNPEAAFMIMNNPLKDADTIAALVKKGYLIRTRADANTTEARQNDYRMFEAAKRSGAQIITTDYYLPSQYFPSTYKVMFEDGVYWRLNPLSDIRK